MTRARPSVEVDLTGLERRFADRAMREKQAAFARRVAFEMRDYVPLDEGTLRDSEPVSSDYESGDVIWNTPYARRVHDLPEVRRVKNPRATPRWPAVAKSERLQAWADFARKLLGR